ALFRSRFRPSAPHREVTASGPSTGTGCGSLRPWLRSILDALRHPHTIHTSGLNHGKRGEADLDARRRSRLARRGGDTLSPNGLGTQPLLTRIGTRQLAPHAAS